MADITIKQLLKIFAVITLIVAAFIVGVYLFLRWAVNIEPPAEKPGGVLPAIQGSAGTQIQAPNESELTPQVIYDGQSFQPTKIFRDCSGSFGWLVVLLNRSAVSLKIGISPHNPARDPGPDYNSIAPGEKLLIDPRFPGVTELNFHNHSNPNQVFAVELGPKCK